MNIFNTAYPYFPSDDIEDILLETREILSGNKMLTMGEHVHEFEKEFAHYCESNHAIATNSCTSALEIVLNAIEISCDDEVIVPIQTFIATGSSVLKSGGKIVFCDVDDNFLLDIDSMKSVITPKTKAVIIVHFGGMISNNIIAIRDYLQERKIFLIEDAAHAHGAYLDNLKAGNIGDFGCFSFYSTKIMTTGEGGMIITNHKNYFEKCSSIRNRGIDIHHKGELFTHLGSNHRVTEFQALLGRFQLKRLEEFSAHRNAIASIYKSILADLADKGIIRFQKIDENGRHAYWRFIVFLLKHDRNSIKEKLNQENIKADAPYFPLLHNQPLFDSLPKNTFHNGEKLSTTHISLPIHMLISIEDAHFIANRLKSLLND